MKLVCRDCRFGLLVKDKSLKLCPQCGSRNIHISLNGVIEERETQQKISRRLECRDCRFGLIVNDESRKHCPQCGSENIEIFLLGSIRDQVGKSKISGADDLCCCFMEILVPLIFFLILFLSIPRHG